MLHISKIEKRYLWGSNGSMYAVLGFDTSHKKMVAITNFDGEVKNGRFIPSNYDVRHFSSYSEAVAYIREKCEMAKPL